MSDFHSTSLEMAWLRLCRITDESTESQNLYKSLNTELRWLWNSVYDNNCFIFQCRFIHVLSNLSEHQKYRTVLLSTKQGVNYLQ